MTLGDVWQPQEMLALLAKLPDKVIPFSRQFNYTLANEMAGEVTHLPQKCGWVGARQIDESLITVHTFPQRMFKFHSDG